MIITRQLQMWYQINKRDLPWRDTSDPYRIWLSEVILQQTRVQQGLEYYYQFIDTFPHIKNLADANEDVVMKLWQGLGYYSRARNMHSAAKEICYHRNGVFPDTYAKLIKLKGVGEYTASAIASFAFNKPHAVLDGNVFRFLSRLYNISTPIDNPQGKIQFRALAHKLLDKKKPALHNQAIMEFGALQCQPSNPNCSQCIFSLTCLAYRNNTVHSTPVKSVKTKKRSRYLHYFFIKYGDNTFIIKRNGKDIWQSLYEFPLIETGFNESPENLLKEVYNLAWFEDQQVKVCSVSQDIIHQLSHQKLHCRFYMLEGKFTQGNNYKQIRLNEIGDYAFPQLIEKYLQETCSLHL